MAAPVTNPQVMRPGWAITHAMSVAGGHRRPEAHPGIHGATGSHRAPHSDPYAAPFYGMA